MGATCDFIATHRMGHCVRAADLERMFPAYLSGDLELPKPGAAAATPYMLGSLTQRLLTEVLDIR